MNLKKAIANTSASKCLMPGLQALGKYSGKIKPADTRKCTGSIDIDKCVQSQFPSESRWDYVIGYDQCVYFVEVHSASGDANRVIQKANWLRNWLKKHAPELEILHYPGKNFHWIPTNGVNLIGKDKMRLAQNKIVVTSVLSLPIKSKNYM